MSIFEKIYNFFDYRIEEPAPYGIFHIVSLILIVLATVLLCKFLLNCTEKNERKLALFVWITLVFLEVYKQLNFSIEFENGEMIWDYSWYAFPFQFCSSPLFILPLVAFLPDGKFREAAVAFMGTFSLFAGLAVCLYPNDVYVETLGIDIQTTIHHGSQIILGIFFALKRFLSPFPPKKKNYFISATAVFSVLVIIAMVLNIIMHNILLSFNIDETFNMFYISPYHSCTLPLLSLIDELVPYPVFLCIYIFGFAVAASVILLLNLLLASAVKRCSKNRV